jgi:hypothetical protein
MADRIQIRRDTASNWTSVNPVLADGEIGLERDTSQFKIGNGTALWSSLPYGGIQGPVATYGNIIGTLADQTDLQAALDAKANTNSPVFSGDATFLGAIDEAVYTLAGTVLDPSNGTIQVKTISANTTLTDSVVEGESLTLMIDDGAGYTVTWPAITWVNGGGSAPTLAMSGYTVIVLWKVSTTLYGALVGDGS